MERNRPGERTEVFLDESSSSLAYLSNARNWTPADGAVPRLIPFLHFPPFVGSMMLRRRLRTADEAHVIGGVATHGALAPRTVPLLAWLGTTIGDERRSVIPYQDFRRRALHRSTLPALERIERAVLSRAQKVLAQSHHTADVLVRDGISAHRIEVRPVPVDTDVYAPGDEERRGILFVGRARDPRKAFHRVTEALSASAPLRDAGVDVISSQAPEVPETAKRAIRWHGHVEDLALRYRSAEVLALSSVQEGLGIVVFEALASGTPVVAMRCGGPDAFIRASGGGFVVDDQRGFTEKLEALVKDRSLANEMGSAGRAYVLENMSGDSFLNDPTIFRL